MSYITITTHKDKNGGYVEVETSAPAPQNLGLPRVDPEEAAEYERTGESYMTGPQTVLYEMRRRG